MIMETNRDRDRENTQDNGEHVTCTRKSMTDQTQTETKHEIRTAALIIHTLTYTATK